MWLLNSLLCLVCTGNVDTSQYEVQFPTADPVHFLPFIYQDFLDLFFFCHIFSLLIQLEQSSNKCRPFFLFFLSLITSITGSGLFRLSISITQAIYPVVFFSSPFLLSPPCLYSRIRPLYPHPARIITETGHRRDQKGNGDWYKKEPTQKNQEFLDSTCCCWCWCADGM